MILTTPKDIVDQVNSNLLVDQFDATWGKGEELAKFYKNCGWTAPDTIRLLINALTYVNENEYHYDS